MIRLMNLVVKKILFSVISCLLILNILTTIPTSIGMTSSKLDFSNNNPIPFNDFYLTYNLKAKRDGLPIFNINLEVQFSSFVNNSSKGTDFQQKMHIKSYLLGFIGESQENATFLENSTTRQLFINNTEGYYISWLIYHVSGYNSSENAKNWDPFWIKPYEINDSYPIYSSYMNVTSRTDLNPSDMNLFNYTRPIVVFNGIENIKSSYENITNKFGLIYDNYTGFLLKGALDSNIISTNASNHYYANFELTDTNGFSVFPPYPIPTDSNPVVKFFPPQLQKPNYLLLIGILFLPIAYTIFRFLRLKEITGGIE